MFLSRKNTRIIVAESARIRCVGVIGATSGVHEGELSASAANVRKQDGEYDAILSIFFVAVFCAVTRHDAPPAVLLINNNGAANTQQAARAREDRLKFLVKY